MIDSPRPSQWSLIRRISKGWVWVLTVLGVIGTALAIAAQLRDDRLADQLLALPPDAVITDPALVDYALARAKPLYVSHCAACHGSSMQGKPAVGAPDLSDAVWLYGDGSVFEIERTLLYGIRSGHGKTRNVTDMPGYGLRGRLSELQVRSLVQYLLKLNGRPYQAGAAEDGRALYYDPSVNCGDCHGGNAKGDPDYGAPDLTVNVWNNGGDPDSLQTSVYSGRHRIMPAWVDTLSLGQIRALSVYIYVASHRSS